MDPDGHDENPYQGTGQGPKLILVGRLEGSVDGRPVSIVANERDIAVACGITSLFSLRAAWRSFGPSLKPFLEQAGLRLLASAGWLGHLEVSPNPSVLVRLMLLGT